MTEKLTMHAREMSVVTRCSAVIQAARAMEEGDNSQPAKDSMCLSRLMLLLTQMQRDRFISDETAWPVCEAILDQQERIFREMGLMPEVKVS